MLNRIALLISIILFFGCAVPPAQKSYRELFRENDFAMERYSPQFYKEAEQYCPEMVRDLEEMQARLNAAEASGHEKASKDLRKDIKWLKGWIRTIRCEYDQALTPAADDERGTIEKSESAGPENERISPAAASPSLTFDECFTKCKKLTSRTNEECFDTCIKR